MYRVRRADTQDDEVCEELVALQHLTFGDTADIVPPDQYGTWWLAEHRTEEGWTTAGFCALRPSLLYFQWGFLMRAGVLPEHRGHGLQRRFISVREAEARKLGYEGLNTYTLHNTHSANNLLRSGFVLYDPKKPYAADGALYWMKRLK